MSEETVTPASVQAGEGEAGVSNTLPRQLKVLAFDTETTGMIKVLKPRLDEIPEMTQLGAVLFDTNQKPVMEFSTLLSHSNIVVPKTEFFINNGMSTERCREYGVPPDVALLYFSKMANYADCLVAHNTWFDWHIVNAAFERYLVPGGHVGMRSMTKYCTMLTLQPHLKIPDTYRPGELKTPSLKESFEKMVNPAGFKGAHNALIDAKVAAKLFFTCLEKNIPLIEPKFA